MSNQYYELIEGFLSPEEIEPIIQQSLEFKKRFYTEENLAQHVAYISDVQPHRVSNAFAVHGSPTPGLPSIGLDTLGGACLELIHVSLLAILRGLGLRFDSRVLFNMQEYFSSSERVTAHHDGELLEFTVDEAGNLDIKRSIRPEKVAVLTLVNDSIGGGTRLHFPDGSEELVQAKAGDLLIFNNVLCKHSVDPLMGSATRPDGLLRMIIGWRSLADCCHYTDTVDGFTHRRAVTFDEANLITKGWYDKEWPEQWKKIQAERQKAPF